MVKYSVLFRGGTYEIQQTNIEVDTEGKELYSNSFIQSYHQTLDEALRVMSQLNSYHPIVVAVTTSR